MVPVILILHGFENPTGRDESAVKAMFVYNFTKYFDWSRIASSNDFVIAVYGQSEIVQYLDEIALRKTVDGKPILIKVITSPEEVRGCQMLFIPENVSRILETFQTYPPANGLVIISESRGALNKGAHINLVNVKGKLQFELNESRMKGNGIKFAKSLSALANGTK
ncbi:MAG: YfiR family protein [Bacteroidota bacterium]|nr:YfiR family protein [Bacteroidota bacterium]